jgi:MSHA type pilus biogenesis protein MshL
LREKIEREVARPVEPIAPQISPLDTISVTLNVDSVDARQVFQTIAAQADLNLVVPASLIESPRAVSLALTDVSASEAFSQVLAALDMSGHVSGNMMVLSEYEEQVFDLDFLQTTTTAKFDAGGDVFGANQSTGGGDESGGSSQSGVKNGFNIQGRNVNDINPFDEIERLLETVLYGGARSAESSNWRADSAVDDGGTDDIHYMLNQSTGTLYVRARPSQIRTVGGLVERYKGILGRQVLIEAQILDIELSDDFQYGIDWARLRNHAAVNYGAAPISLGSVSGQVPDAGLGSRGVTLPAQNIGGSGARSLSAVYGNSQQTIAVDMLKAFGVVHVLSNPSLRVRNTQPAVVSVGRNERYIAQTTSNVSNSGGGQSTVSANVVTGNLFDGVMLGVIPYIDEFGEISLTINPVQTTVQPGSSELINVGTEENPQRISLPKVDFKGITTSLNINDGDTVILGGLISDSGTNAKAGIPILAEIPLFGELMGALSKTTRARELVVVLRVEVL